LRNRITAQNLLEMEVGLGSEDKLDWEDKQQYEMEALGFIFTGHLRPNRVCPCRKSGTDRPCHAAPLPPGAINAGGIKQVTEILRDDQKAKLVFTEGSPLCTTPSKAGIKTSSRPSLRPVPTSTL
jgi:hypothetical protein